VSAARSPASVPRRVRMFVCGCGSRSHHLLSLSSALGNAKRGASLSHGRTSSPLVPHPLPHSHISSPLLVYRTANYSLSFQESPALAADRSSYRRLGVAGGVTHRCDHGVWLTLAQLISVSALNIPGVGRLLFNNLEDSLLRWVRSAELTCDRAALLVAQVASFSSPFLLPPPPRFRMPCACACEGG